MQFQSLMTPLSTTNNYHNHSPLQHHPHSHGPVLKTDFSMYLPGMGRNPTKSPVVVLLQARKGSMTDTTTKEMKKPTVTVEKPSPRTTTTVVTPITTTTPTKQDQVETTIPFNAIRYRVWPGGPIQTFFPTMANHQTTTAAILVQKRIRGMSARVQHQIRTLERQLVRMNTQRDLELQAIQQQKEEQKMIVRQKVTKKHATLMKIQLNNTTTANQGSELIHYLRKENKKLREKNTKIAASIHALRVQNEQLENLTCATGENQDVLGRHYTKIQETNTVLISVVPQYESKIAELTEALEVREQYCTVEHHTKIMYRKLIATITEMMEQDCPDPELMAEILQLCAELPPQDTAGVTDTTPSTTSNDAMIDAFALDDEVIEHDETSVADDDDDEYHHNVDNDDHDDDYDDDDTDSNNYDDYMIAGMD
jgi:hypothetical protein